MARKLLVLSSAILALLIVSAVSNPADARRGGHGFRHHGGGHFHGRSHFGHHRHFHHRHGHHGHRHHRHHGHIFIGAPFLYGGYYAYGDCYWLRRRALYTGSPYWWNRYYACIGDY